ncbi:MAG: DAK2 domain-containing protein [Candidatus Cloacimonetes bacterium]|nr:DAK2 domain-containing protein [Candidatus Cloacimonadota bacterium]
MTKKINKNKSLTTSHLDSIIHDGLNLLSNQKNAINNLNVFPVPDGDTGLNMTLTLQGALNSLKNYNLEVLGIQDYLKHFANGLMLNSRGCSGVILALFTKGVVDTLQSVSESDEISNSNVSYALKNGYILAYKETTNPCEGTILTMMKVFSEYFAELAKNNKYPVEIIKNIIPVLEETLDKTPEMLPILKKAGVVDSGAMGFLILIKGMVIGLEYNGILIKSLLNIATILAINKYIRSIVAKKKHRKKTNLIKTIISNLPPKNINNISLAYIIKQFNALIQKESSNTSAEIIIQKSEDLSNSWNPDLPYRYCTEFILNSKKINTDFLQTKFENFGDSIIILQSGNCFKVHIHTNKPKSILKLCSNYGEISSTKIDDMKKQHRNLISEDKAFYEKDKAVLLIVNGDGFAEILKGLEATDILLYGKNKPSVNHIQNALLKTRAKNIIVAADDKDILAGIKSAITLCKSNIELIESKDIVQIISMMYNYSSISDVMNNAQLMRKNLNNIKYCKIAKATRDFKEDDLFINKGDYFTLYQNKILLANTKILEVVIQSISKIKNNESLVTLYNGKMRQNDNRILSILKSKFNNIDIEKYYGGQLRYNYYITFE